MKKLFVMAVMAVAALNANAQWWAGGSFALDFDNNGDEKTTSFEIAPEVGYNLTDKWSVAIALGFGTTNNNLAAIGDRGESTIYGGKLDKSLNYFKVAPYARYTFCKSGAVSFFVDGGIGFKFYNQERGNSFNVGVRPGIAFAVSKKVSLVATTGYIGYQKDSEKRGKGSKFGLGVDNKINFAAYYNF